MSLLTELFSLAKKESISFSKLESKPSYNFLVVAARQDELSEFFNQTSFKQKKKIELGTTEIIFEEGKSQIKILAYTPNTMGMAFNAAAIMRVICKHQPIYTLFIGTCAGLDSENYSIGDVIVPQNIYNYESGKHKDGKVFHPDQHCYSTDDELRTFAEILKTKLSKKMRIITDEHFCSGSAVIDSKEKKGEIKKDLPRKVNGLDMEAYSIACINYLLREEGKKLTVIKSIMDFGEDKSESEKNNNKLLAMRNSAMVALELIKYIHTDVLAPQRPIYLR